ncbi:peptidoglycan DD-metalloendopeptidase family protein [Flavobacterium sp. 25HG05S-40]|uniref:peptidoglycan DD-metalloendopeptidase family protein n=1 Tax=Flavobacterium sp. 25HG05S-40 TaxID=3458682 RepID=UPI004043F46D
MKTLLLLLTIVSIYQLQAQNNRMADGGGAYNMNQEYTECLSNEQRLIIRQQLNENINYLKSEGKINNNNSINGGNPVHPLFVWPVTKSVAAPYNNVWSISNHVDHNPNFPNALQDWNCGNRTYDTNGGYNHQGLDIFTWPFTLYQMDNNQAVVVAAADGIILLKSNGNFDRSCAFNNNNWNAVYIQHADGSESWYGHLKNGSLTTKIPGDFIAAGEYVGIVGSSGNSTAPHLHFEVYNSSGGLVDTYNGPCNSWSASNDTWWQNQKPYLDPKINAVLSHSAPPQFNSCPTTEVPNINNSFSNGSNVVLAIYLADQLANTSVNMVLRRPDNSIQSNWNFSLVNQFSASWWYWTFPAFEMTQQGIYQFTATYQGSSVTHNFMYGNLSVAENEITKFSITPNPARESFTIDFNDNSVIENVSLFDMLGKAVFQSNSSEKTISIAGLSKGVYSVKIVTQEGSFSSKIVKQ